MDILSVEPVDLSHPSWCSPLSCTAPDRLAERGVEESAVPLSRRGAHFSAAHVIPASRASEVELRFELFRDVYVEPLDQPDGVQLSTHSEMCGHSHTLVLTAEQTGPLAVAAAAMRDACQTYVTSGGAGVTAQDGHPSWCDQRHSTEWPTHTAQVGADLQLSADLSYAVLLFQQSGQPAQVHLIRHTPEVTSVTSLSILEASILRDLLDEGLGLIAREAGLR